MGMQRCKQFRLEKRDGGVSLPRHIPKCNLGLSAGPRCTSGGIGCDSYLPTGISPSGIEFCPMCKGLVNEVNGRVYCVNCKVELFILVQPT